MELSLDPNKTALVAIDLQKGIVGGTCAPHAAADVVARTTRIAQALRAKGGFVVLVHVGPLDGRDMLHPITDAPAAARPAPPPDWTEIDPSLLPHANLVVRKRQWGAFYGTELDLQLRRRRIRTILLCGISTHIGVESTARDAYERGYDHVFVEDAMAARSAVEHEHTVARIFPRLGRVRKAAEVAAALRSNG